MTKQQLPSRIVELIIKRSQIRPNFGYAIGSLLPCNHKQFLGVTPWLKKYGDGNSVRVNSCKIIYIESREVTDKQPCSTCPDTLDWLGDLSSVLEVEQAIEPIDIWSEA